MDVFVMLFHVSRYFGRRLQENHPLYSKDKSSLSNIKQHSITVGLTFPVLLVWGLSVANHHTNTTSSSAASFNDSTHIVTAQDIHYETNYNDKAEKKIPKEHLYE